MPKVHGTHHTRLDYVSVAPYDVKTFLGIDLGPLEMASYFFFHHPSFCPIERFLGEV